MPGRLIQELHAVTGCSPLPLRPSCAPMGICGGTDIVELSGGGESLCIPSSRLRERLPLVTAPVEYSHIRCVQQAKYTPTGVLLLLQNGHTVYLPSCPVHMRMQSLFQL